MRMEENKNRKAGKSVGRKSKADPAVYRYGIKFNSQENDQFELLFRKSGMAYRARFIKAVLLNKEIKVVRIDKAAMEHLKEIGRVVYLKVSYAILEKRLAERILKGEYLED